MLQQPFAECGITNLRRELKVLLEPHEAEVVVAQLAWTAPPQESRVVAVYFDSAGGKLARRAVRRPGDCVKVRAKAYDPDLSRSPGRVVLEVKRERGGITSKERVWVERSRVRAALSGALAAAFGRLAPVLATSYRRRVFQSSSTWRVTVDDALSFHPAEWRLFADGAPAWHGALAPPLGAEALVVVELKYGPDGLPPWLAELARARARPYSKFATGCGLAARGRSMGA